MNRPLTLVLLSLVTGIIVSDVLFYQQNEIPKWLGMAAWGFCLLVTLLALLTWSKEYRKGLGRWLFPVLVSSFFVVVGFTRYADYAEDVKGAWASMDRPPVNRGNPDEFDFVRWRWIQGVEDSASWTARLRHRALKLRAALAERYAIADMDAEAQAIVVASTLGDRSQLSSQTRDLYSAAGASHLLALSGLHLSIIVGLFLMFLNGRLYLSRWRPLVGGLVILFIWCYAFVAGLPTSLVRASLMMSLFLVGSLLNRNGQPLHWLVLTALVMLLIRPVYLFDVGAQLSFAAVAGIVVLYRRINRWAFSHWRQQLYWLESHYLLWPLSLFTVSLCAQAFTFPLVAYYFHQIPLYAPLLNIALIPMTTMLIYGSLFLLLIAFVPLCAPLVPLCGKALSLLVAAQLSIMQFSTRLPGAVVHDFWSRKAVPQVVVYNNWRCPALHVIAAPDSSWLLMPEPDSLQSGMHYIASSFWRRRLTEEPQLLKGQSVTVGGFTAVMVDGELDEHSEYTQVDVLWLTKGFNYRDLNCLKEAFGPRLLVLDASLPRWQREALRSEASRVGWNVYDVSAKGALRFKLEAK